MSLTRAKSKQLTHLVDGTGAVVQTLFDKLKETISVKDFGAVGDATYDFTTNAITGTDDTAAFQAAINYASSVGAHLIVPAGQYRITAALDLSTNYVEPFSIGGQNGMSTYIYFDVNTGTPQNLFDCGLETNYLEIHDLYLVDVTPRTNRCIYMKDTVSSADRPTWKFIVRNCRIWAFKEGARLDGGATIGDDAHCSEFMWFHSKMRNCETGLVLNNIQAVNQQLVGMDFENDDALDGTEHWTHIEMLKGTTLNHFGGSVIGCGSYVKYTFPAIGGHFQETSRVTSKGIRVEYRGGTGTQPPLIYHSEASVITLSNYLRLDIEDMSISCTPATMVLGQFGGNSYARFKNIVSNKPADVEAHMTPNVESNNNTGLIDIIDCAKVTYSRKTEANYYGSTGTTAANVYKSIPVEYTTKRELGPFFSGLGTSASPLILNSHVHTTQYAGKPQISQPKSYVWSSYDEAGTGFIGTAPQTQYLKLPVGARPFRFRAIRDLKWTGSAYTMEMYIRIGGVDYLVGTLAIGTNYGGFETAITLPTGTTLVRGIVDDGTEWDGTFSFVKAAGSTVNGFTGQLIVDYM